MGRKSRLTPEQWAEIERKHLIEGASINSLAKAYGVDESTLRKKINPNKPEADKSEKSLRELALAKLEADRKSKDISDIVASLPMSRQQTFNGLFQKLSSISEHLASAAEYGAMTSHRLMGIVSEQVEKIDDAQPEKSADALTRIIALTRTANLSAEIPLRLLQANKDAVKPEEEPPGPVEVTFVTKDARKPAHEED